MLSKSFSELHLHVCGITFDFILSELAFEDESWQYERRIAENVEKKARRIAREEAEKAIELAAHTIEKEKEMI